MAYILDSDVFIDAKNRYYGFDFAPAFWEWLVRKNDEGCIFSVEDVRNELEEGNDELCDWIRGLGNRFFLPPTDQMVNAERVVSDWVQMPEQQYLPRAVADFLDCADLHVVAYARALNYTVVTLEKIENTRKKVKVPNVCNGLNIECINTFQMLRREQPRFVLG